MGTCFFTKPLLSNGCRMFAYSVVFVQQRTFFVWSLLSNRPTSHIMNSSSPCSFLPLRFEYSPQNFVLRHPESVLFMHNGTPNFPRTLHLIFQLLHCTKDFLMRHNVIARESVTSALLMRQLLRHMSKACCRIKAHGRVA